MTPSMKPLDLYPMAQATAPDYAGKGLSDRLTHAKFSTAGDHLPPITPAELLALAKLALGFTACVSDTTTRTALVTLLRTLGGGSKSDQMIAMLLATIMLEAGTMLDMVDKPYCAVGTAAPATSVTDQLLAALDAASVPSHGQK